MNKNKKNRFGNIIFYLMFILLLGFSFVIFYSYYGTSSNHITFGDSLVYDYPNKFITSNAFRLGIYPLWDQWRFNGMPDSFNVSFYNISPLVLFSSFFGNYTMTIYTIDVFIVQILCFLGMFYWLKMYVNRWIALYGAFCFSICPMIVTTVPEENPLTTMSMIPFLAYSLKLILGGSKRHIGLFALFLLIIFSTGYLGLNILFLPIIFLFVYSEHFFVLLQGKYSKRFIYLVKMSVPVFLAILLFIGISNLEWLQLWEFTKLSLNSLRWVPYSPFSGAAHMKEIFTLFFVNNFPSFIPWFAIIPSPSNTYMIYIGIFNLCLLLYSLFHKKYLSQTLLLAFFSIFIFAISLDSNYATGFFATKFLPFLQFSRWHGWYLVLVEFFMITLTCFGLGILYKQFDKKELKKLLLAQIIILVLLTVSIILLIVKSSPHPYNFFTLQLIFLLTFIFITSYGFLVYKSIKKFDKKFIVILFVFVGLTEYIPNSFHYLSYRDRAASFINTDAKSFVAQLNKNARYNFTYKSNIRANSVNSQITKIPTSSLERSVLSAPSMHHLRMTLGEKEFLYLTHYIFYFPDTNQKPIAVLSKTIKITQFEPNSISATVNSRKVNQQLIWSSTYTPDWKLYINGYSKSTSQAAFGFTTFKLQKGKNDITLIYHPNYLSWSIAFQIIAVCIMIGLIFYDSFWTMLKKFMK